MEPITPIIHTRQTKRHQSCHDSNRSAIVQPRPFGGVTPHSLRCVRCVRLMRRMDQSLPTVRLATVVRLVFGDRARPLSRRRHPSLLGSSVPVYVTQKQPPALHEVHQNSLPAPAPLWRFRNTNGTPTPPQGRLSSTAHRIIHSPTKKITRRPSAGAPYPAAPCC